MKILKISGIVAGLHVLALVLIFAIPGCNSTSQPAALTAAAPAMAAPVVPIAEATPVSPLSAAPDLAPPEDGADAGAAASPAGIAFYPPTRPGTPAAQELAGKPGPEVTPAVTYEVKSGDTLGAIALRHHIRLSELRAANRLRSGSVIHPGQKLLIPTRSGPRPRATEGRPESAPHSASAPSAPSGAESTYVVKPGDRLSSIAHRFGLTTGRLAAANNITNPRLIRAGQSLVIPKGRGVRKKRMSTPRPEAAPAPEPPPAASPNPEPTPVVPVPPAASNGPSSDAVPVIRIPAGGSAPNPDAGGANPSS
ncbi:MAG: LysM peptidoglycan-binding domain-containing protein [Opitutaceae bacterium]